MRLEHHLVGGYVRYISPYIIYIIILSHHTLLVFYAFIFYSILKQNHEWGLFIYKSSWDILSVINYKMYSDCMIHSNNRISVFCFYF